MRTTCAIGALFTTAVMAAVTGKMAARDTSFGFKTLDTKATSGADGGNDNDVPLPWEAGSRDDADDADHDADLSKRDEDVKAAALDEEKDKDGPDEVKTAEFDEAEAEAALVALESGADSFQELVRTEFADYAKPNHEDLDDMCYNSRFQIIQPISESNCYHSGYSAETICRRFRGLALFAQELADLADRVTQSNVNAFNARRTQGALYKLVSGLFLLSDLLAELRRGLRVTTANFNEAEERNIEACFDQNYIRALIAFLRIVNDFDDRFRLTYSDTPLGNNFGFSFNTNTKRELVARELQSQGPTSFAEIFWAVIDFCGEQETLVAVLVSKIRRRYIQQAIINDQGPISPTIPARPGQVNYYCRGILEWSSRLAPMIRLGSPDFNENDLNNDDDFDNGDFFNNGANNNNLGNNGFNNNNNNNGFNGNSNNNNNNGFFDNNNNNNNNNNGFNGVNNNNNGFNNLNNANVRGNSIPNA